MIQEADLDGDGQIDFLEFERVNKPSVASCVAGRKASQESIVAPPKPPDGGWGWVIVFACFMCNLVINGFRFGAFAILKDPLSHSFCAKVSSVAWASSLSCGLLSIFGPFIAGLINRFGMRTICI